MLRESGLEGSAGALEVVLGVAAVAVVVLELGTAAKTEFLAYVAT